MFIILLFVHQISSYLCHIIVAVKEVKVRNISLTTEHIGLRPLHSLRFKEMSEGSVQQIDHSLIDFIVQIHYLFSIQYHFIYFYYHFFHLIDQRDSVSIRDSFLSHFSSTIPNPIHLLIQLILIDL